MLGQEFICQEETGDILARKGKATRMADHGAAHAAFSTSKKRNFLVKINQPKFENLFVKRHEMIKIFCVPSKLLSKSINERI